jgi:DNA-binding NtrC family response regulator
MSTKPSILIVEDEKNTRDGLARALRRSYKIVLAENGQRALEILSERSIDVILSDVRMPGMDGMTLMKRALARSPQPVFILLTAYGSVEHAVEAMKEGADDYMTKPVHLDALELKIRQLLKARKMETENRSLHTQLDAKYGIEHIVGKSAAMQDVFDTIRQVSTSRATVLVEGESGTGKELVAHAIHQLSPRARRPFVAVHCAALSENLLESELFGHEKGAFTGAAERRRGRFEMADGGTLFLDEIGEIDLNTQVKILRVLEERRFERVGGQTTLDVDVRLVTATNKNLKQMVEEGKFREDLFYRLYVVAIRIPPLRERREDIPLLVRHFLTQTAEENGKEIEGLTPDALHILSSYDWPGNVRELRNAVERMVVLSHGTKLTVRDIPASVRDHAVDQGPIRTSSEISLQEAEKQLIVQALRAHGGNRTRAAEQLGISRRTLHRKLNEYGLREDEAEKRS